MSAQLAIVRDEAADNLPSVQAHEPTAVRSGASARLVIPAALCFVADAAESGLDRKAAGMAAERVFMKLLRAMTEQGRRVNANGGSTYAPKAFADSAEAEGITKRAFRGAMDALFHAGKIRNMETGPHSRRSTFIEEADT